MTRLLGLLVAMVPVPLAATCGDRNACDHPPVGIGAVVTDAQASSGRAPSASGVRPDSAAAWRAGSADSWRRRRRDLARHLGVLGRWEAPHERAGLPCSNTHFLAVWTCPTICGGGSPNTALNPVMYGLSWVLREKKRSALS